MRMEILLGIDRICQRIKMLKKGLSVAKKAKGIRKGVNCVGVCVVYFCHDGKGNFIMGKRSNNARDERGRWDIGGGGLEFGDTLKDTISKEIQEEYRTDILDIEFLGYRDVHRKHNGKPTHWIALDFKVKVDPAKVKNGEPHKFEKVKWFTLNTIPDNLHSQIPIF